MMSLSDEIFTIVKKQQRYENYNMNLVPNAKILVCRYPKSVPP